MAGDIGLGCPHEVGFLEVTGIVHDADLDAARRDPLCLRSGW
jgi:hypothetical protein